MSAEIIGFIPSPKRDDEQTDFPTIVFRFAVPDAVADRADTTSHAAIEPEGGKT